MNKKEVDISLNKISEKLEPCPVCEGKAEILAMHTTAKDVIIDSVGCIKCHLAVERIWSGTSETKLFAKRTKTEVDPVHVWNSIKRTTPFANQTEKTKDTIEDREKKIPTIDDLAEKLREEGMSEMASQLVQTRDSWKTKGIQKEGTTPVEFKPYSGDTLLKERQEYRLVAPEGEEYKNIE